MRRAPLFLASLSMLLTAQVAAAQDRPWIAEFSVGWAGLVDDSTKNYVLVGGSLRRYVTPRFSIGPEFVVMNNSNLITDLLMMLTGNAVYDFYPASGPEARRVTPFVVGGVGIFRGRDQVRNGPFWFSDPSFTAGGGVRARISDAFSAGGEYRIGWEPHQRLSGFVALAW
jgi:hypothetical protein